MSVDLKMETVHNYIDNVHMTIPQIAMRNQIICGRLHARENTSGDYEIWEVKNP